MLMLLKTCNPASQLRSSHDTLERLSQDYTIDCERLSCKIFSTLVAGRRKVHLFLSVPEDERFFNDTGQEVFPSFSKWVSHTLFGKEFVLERIIWFSENISQAYIGKIALLSQAYIGLPKLPGTIFPHERNKSAQRPVKEDTRGKQIRKILWHLRHRPCSSTKATESSLPLWLYMDRSHAASDNAEAFYRYAVKHEPRVEHLFAISPQTPDGKRLIAEGFNVVDPASEAFDRAIKNANILLLSDISDPYLVPRLQDVPQHHRIVYIQHGIIREQLWRWLNSRRIDTLITTLPDETQKIIGNYSHYKLSAPEVYELGLPRHDALLHSRAQATTYPYLLIAPTWVPSLRDSSDVIGFGQWLQWWTEGVQNTLEISGATLHPVFFMHPNMERLYEQWIKTQSANLMPDTLKIPSIIFGAELQRFLSQSAIVISDRSSIVDEGILCGIPGVFISPIISISPTPISSPLLHRYANFRDLALSLSEILETPFFNTLPHRSSCKALLNMLN